MFGILFELCICYNAVFYSILCIIIKKMLKKSFPIYCGIGKKQYFCTRFPEGTPLTGAATQGAAKKSFRKICGNGKNALSLQTI